MSSLRTLPVDQTAQALDTFVRSVRGAYGQRLKRVMLFGSRARGEAREDSDFDVAVVLDTITSRSAERNILSDLAYDIMIETSLEIQPWPISEDEWSDPDRHANPFLVRSMRRDGVALSLQLDQQKCCRNSVVGLSASKIEELRPEMDMNRTAHRTSVGLSRTEMPSRHLPPIITSTLQSIFDPRSIWLFGSRARGDNRPDSDWDVLVVVDDAHEDMTDPIKGWEATYILHDLGIETTILVTTESDLEDIWGLPNTIGYDLAREGVKIHVAGNADCLQPAPRRSQPEKCGGAEAGKSADRADLGSARR